MPRLLKEVLNDACNTLSFGRCVALWFCTLFSAVVLVMLVAFGVEVRAGRETEFAALLHEAAAPIITLITGLTSLSTLPYLITKLITKGGVTSEQLDGCKPPEGA